MFKYAEIYVSVISMTGEIKMLSSYQNTSAVSFFLIIKISKFISKPKWVDIIQKKNA